MMQAFDVSRDTGELIGIARVLEYGRPTPRIELATTVTERGERTTRTPRKVSAPLPIEERDGLLYIAGRPDLLPVKRQVGRRTLVSINKLTSDRSHNIYVAWSCQCAATGRSQLSEWRGEQHKRCLACSKEDRKRNYNPMPAMTFRERVDAEAERVRRTPTVRGSVPAWKNPTPRWK